MAPQWQADSDVLRTTTSLVDYLVDLTDAGNRNPVRDITAQVSGAPNPLLWWAEIPGDVQCDAEADDVILTVAPVRTVAPPELPDELVDWVGTEAINDPDHEPRLRGPQDAEETESGPSRADLTARFERWRRRWRAWAEEETRRRKHRVFHEKLEEAAKRIEQRDDEFEFVLAVGLVQGRRPDGQNIRRHLLTEHAVPTLDRSGVVTVRRVPGRRRMEDREIFEGQDTYRPDRGRSVRDQLVASEAPLLAESTISGLRDWLGYAIDAALEDRQSRHSDVPASRTFAFTPAAALLLRPRSRVLLTEAYRRIAEVLRAPNAEVPVALSQIVVNTQQEQRARWLAAQGAVQGDVLGSDPLFPLAANTEQSRVIDLLRAETGVVVQGPPGTGKTHTIANLISALLARGQRVLVTSQKDQALRVLRDKIPDELRKLCVLLAGGSKNAAVELQQSIDALATALASNDEAELEQQTTSLHQEREHLRSESARLNQEIRTLRETELVKHGPLVPDFSTEVYTGSLATIIREVRDHADEHDWMPAVPDDAHVRDIPPLHKGDFAELLRLLRQRTSQRQTRGAQEIPATSELPSTTELTELVRAERATRTEAEREDTELPRQIAQLSEERLAELETIGKQAWEAIHASDLRQEHAPNWITRAAGDQLGRTNAGLWDQLLQVREEPRRLLQALQQQGLGPVVEFSTEIMPENLGAARQWLTSGKQLLDYVRRGYKIRSLLPAKEQKHARPLLDAVLVDGTPITTAAQLDVALQRIEAEVAAMQLVRKWADVGVEVEPAAPTVMLSQLDDNVRRLEHVADLGQLHQRVRTMLSEADAAVPLGSITAFTDVLESVASARRLLRQRTVSQRVNERYEHVREHADRASACPELARLLTAISERDIDDYTEALNQLELARQEQQAELRCLSLLRTLRNVHAQLADLLERTAHDPMWNDRDIVGAWAWSRARDVVSTRRDADRERELSEQFDANEKALARVTERLVAIETTRECLRRLTDDHQRALNTYRALVGKIGAGTGRKVTEYRKAARSAMAKAQDAVPAWVVPLPNLLENIQAQRDRFDVVIVDEASQVGIEHLYLLWMAPRVIVVGDEKQCTPSASALGQLDTVFSRNDDHLAGIDRDIRRLLTPKSNLYELLTARSGRRALVRLREHFRCVPEIIRWSSSQFYDDGTGQSGLIPLRERKGGDLTPLRVTQVDGGFTEGREARKHNPIEAKQIVETLLECLQDPGYEGKTFGVVVLQHAVRHIQSLESLIHEAIPLEVRQERKIRVGTAPYFQGDERDVIFLSMLIAGPSPKATAEVYRQTYNVAASRARDQLWLFTSVGIADLNSEDLRTSLLGYMLDPPSVFGRSPDLDEVSEDQRTDPFESRLEQRVFRRLKRMGYHVVPQYPLGRRRIDLVVAGEGGRIAIECDGEYWHSGFDARDNDARRDQELARMRWDTVRIRESEYESDPDRELDRLWKLLRRKGIHPADTAESGDGAWTPITLPETDENEDPL